MLTEYFVEVPNTNIKESGSKKTTSHSDGNNIVTLDGFIFKKICNNRL